MDSSWRPFEQGDCDSLCGLYAIVNSARFVLGPTVLSDAQAGQLFSHLAAKVESRYGLAEVLEHGLDPKPLWLLTGVAQRYLQQRWRIGTEAWLLPQQGKLSGFNRFARELGKLLARRGAVAIFGCTSPVREHWSVVRAVTKHHLLLLDSSGDARIALSTCRLEDDQSDLPQIRTIDPASIIVFRAKP